MTARPPVASPVDESVLPPCTVLVVDDDPLVLANTAAILEDLGHAVHTASCGDEALRLLGRGLPIDLVVTDQLMPEMTGAQLARFVRRTAPDTPVLIVSGFAEMQDGDAALFPMLHKPFSREQLLQALRQLREPRTVVPFRRQPGPRDAAAAG